MNPFNPKPEKVGKAFFRKGYIPLKSGDGCMSFPLFLGSKSGVKCGWVFQLVNFDA